MKLQQFNLQVIHPHCVIINMYFVTVDTQHYNKINQEVSPFSKLSSDPTSLGIIHKTLTATKIVRKH